MKITFSISIGNDRMQMKWLGAEQEEMDLDNQSETRSTQSKSYHWAYGRN